MNFYSVKVIYQHVVSGDKTRTFFEEQILTVMASDFDDAYAKAEKYAKENCEKYSNPYGHTVQSYFKAVDCFLAFDKEDGVQEIYSCIKTNNSKLSDEEFDAILCDQCSADDMYPLRQDKFHVTQKNKSLIDPWESKEIGFLTLAAERYSVRKFEDRHLEQEVIDRILSAGHVAPTGCNYQPQRILVLNSDESIDRLKKCTRCHFDAPTAMLICYNKEESWVRKYDGALSAPVDAAIVTTHMMLMAHAIGVGSCWVMHFNPFKMREEFVIPETIEPLALLVMGYPHKDATPIDMHTKVRPIDEVVIYDRF